MKKLMLVSAVTLAIASIQPAMADHDRKRSYDRHGHRYEYRDHRKYDRSHQYRHHDSGHYYRDHGRRRYHNHGYYHRNYHGKHVHHNHSHRHHIVYRHGDDDYYKWVGGALILSEIIHHAGSN